MMETRISYSKLNLLGDHFKKANANIHTSMLNGFQKRVRHLSLKSTPGMQKKKIRITKFWDKHEVIHCKVCRENWSFNLVQASPPFKKNQFVAKSGI